MIKITFGEYGDIYRTMKSLDVVDEKVSLVIQGWRWKLLMPYICYFMENAVQKPEKYKNIKINKFGWTVRAFWLSQLLTLYKIALDKKKEVYIKHLANKSIIEFSDKAEVD